MIQYRTYGKIAHLPELNGYSLGGVSAKDLILQTWHLCHDQRKLQAELLEACKAAIEIDNQGQQGTDGNFYPVFGNPLRSILEQAIAKAEGRGE